MSTLKEPELQGFATESDGSRDRQETGKLGEEIACGYLLSEGYEVLSRNWRHRLGELDVVAKKSGYVVAVEVKTRWGTGYGAPLEAITYAKVRRLRKLIAIWAQENLKRSHSLRVDGIGITLRVNADPLIEHVAGI